MSRTERRPPIGGLLLCERDPGNQATPTIVLVALLLMLGTQFTLFAMWFDIESNKHLR